MPVTNFPDGLNIGSSAGATAVFQLGATEVAVTAAELNAIHNASGLSATEFDMLDGAIGGKALGYDSATPMVVASGSTVITGAGTIASGLGATVQHVVASLANAAVSGGTVGATSPAVVFARVSGASLIFECYATNGGTAATAGTVNWIALGTAAA